MIKFDELVKSLLNDLEIRNTSVLKVQTINSSMIERLNKINKEYKESESLLFKIFNDKPTNTLTKLIRKLKSSNEMINQSDSALTKIFNNLGS